MCINMVLTILYNKRIIWSDLFLLNKKSEKETMKILGERGIEEYQILKKLKILDKVDAFCKKFPQKCRCTKKQNVWCG